MASTTPFSAIKFYGANWDVAIDNISIATAINRSVPDANATLLLGASLGGLAAGRRFLRMA